MQAGFAEATIDTLTGCSGLTVMVIVFEVAGFPELHVSLEVIVQIIISPFTGIYE